MHVENSPDFKTVWELAHNWVSADCNITDPTAVSPELRVAIHRLMHAMANGKILLDGKDCESLWMNPIFHQFLTSITFINSIDA